MAARKRNKAPENPYLVADSPDELGPSDRIAYDIMAERRDLQPSVDRIMNAELDDDKKLEAMTLFQNALGTVGDPNRDPRVSIAAVGGA